MRVGGKSKSRSKSKNIQGRKMLTTVELLKKLAAHRPVSGDLERVNAAVRELQGVLEGENVHTRCESLEGRLILYAATAPTAEPEVLLNAHLDVVPAEEATYSLREENGLLFGRGTHDCLGNSAVVASTLVRLNGKASVGAIFSTDEEVGGITTRTMVERGYRGRQLVLVLDGKGYAVTVAQKGILNVVLRAHGKACHAAEPWKGDNAIDKLLAGYVKARALFPPLQAGDEWHNTMAGTIIQAGSVANRVPEVAEMTLNIRFTKEKDAAGIVKQLETATDLEVVPHVDCLPLAFDRKTPAIRELVQFMHTYLKTTITVDRINGATDARHFARLGVPVAIIGVPGKDAHGAAECVDLDALRTYEDMLVAFLSARPAPP